MKGNVLEMLDAIGRAGAVLVAPVLNGVGV